MTNQEPHPDSIYPIYTRAEAAKKLLLSINTLAKITRERKIIPITVGVSVRYSHAALTRFIRDREEAAQDKANAHSPGNSHAPQTANR